MKMQISVVVPVFNEARTIEQVCDRLRSLPSDQFELIFVDDGSTDETQQLLAASAPGAAIVIQMDANQGKTAAVRAGLKQATGDWVIVQDADLEYEPRDIARLLDVAETSGGAVYGQRPSYWNRPGRWLFASGVLLVDLCLLLVYRRWVRDHATCYKLMPTQMLRDFDLQSTGFEGCVEITAKLMRSGIPIRQIPISYSPRTTSEGKKLTWRYGFAALRAVWRWRNWQPTVESAESSTAIVNSGLETTCEAEVLTK